MSASSRVACNESGHVIGAETRPVLARDGRRALEADGTGCKGLEGGIKSLVVLSCLVVVALRTGGCVCLSVCTHVGRLSVRLRELQLGAVIGIEQPGLLSRTVYTRLVGVAVRTSLWRWDVKLPSPDAHTPYEWTGCLHALCTDTVQVDRYYADGWIYSEYHADGICGTLMSRRVTSKSHACTEHTDMV